MATPDDTVTDRAEILATITAYLSALSSAQPADARNHILPDSHAVLSHPDGGLTTCTLGDLVSRAEEGKEKETTIALAAPGPEVWIGGRFAAVWTGLSVTATSTGTETHRGAAAYTLFKREEGWRIGALADKRWAAGAGADTPAPVFSEGAPPADMVEPTLELCRLLNEERWDEVEALMLPGGGATYVRFPHTLVIVGWKDFFGKMRVMLEKAKPGYVEQALMDWEGGSCGDVGVVWTPFTVALDGEIRIRGYNVFSMLKKDGKWLISGAQDG